jgi:hypothetical protein
MSSVLEPQEALPSVFQISRSPRFQHFPPFTEQQDRKGIYLWEMRYVFSPGSQNQVAAPPGPQISPIANGRENVLMHVDQRAAKRRKKEGDASLIRMLTRSLPFIGFLLIASFTSGVSTWSTEEKIGIAVLIPILIAWSIYAWWPRQR